MYENAPATKMVATHCCCCGKPLVDAKSVECGVGPICRKKHKYVDIDSLVSEEQRKTANSLVYAVASDQKNAELVTDNCKALFEMGLSQLAGAILRRCAKVKIVNLDDSRFAVQTPYNELAIDSMKKIYGRKWDGETKTNSFPVEAKFKVYEVLQKHYAGKAALGPKGPFVITPFKAKLSK